MNQDKQEQHTAWEIIGVFVKWRRLLLFSFIAAAILTFIIASFMPKYYTSSASLFPPERDTGGLGIASSLLGGGLGSLLSGSGMALPSFATLSDVYASILKSRIVAEGVLDKNHMMEVYEIESQEKALTKLQGALNVEVQPNGILVVSFEDRDPKRAAVLVQSFIDELNRINSEVRVDKATATRQFIEERLAQSNFDLTNAENAFKSFQEKYKTIALDAQMNAMIGNLADLKSQLVLAEIQLGVLKHTFLPTHVQIKQKEAQISEINKQIKIIEQGSPDKKEGEAMAIPFSEAPELSLQLVRLTRDLKIQEAIFELLTQQYEQAKISELQDTPTIQILDPPRVPELKSRPKRLTMSVLAGMLSVLMSVMAVFAKEFIDRNKQANTQTYQYMESILHSLKTDFYALRSLFASKKGDKRDRTG
jgi:tyrosine-protein kinase Etk/Wzc